MGHVHLGGGPGLIRMGLIRMELIRMETPVDYFYTDAPAKISVHVDFPDGLEIETALKTTVPPPPPAR